MIKVVIRNIPEVQFFLTNVTRGAVKVAIKAISLYIRGNERRGLKHSPPKRYVSRKKAYGKTFASDKQRRFMFASGILKSFASGVGLRQSRRTGKQADAWKYKETKAGYGGTLENRTESAYYTQSPKGQAAQPRLVGWRKTISIIKSNMKGARLSATWAINRFLKSNK